MQLPQDVQSIKAQIEASVQLLKECLHWDEMLAEAEALRIQCENPSLWDNQRNAQKLLQTKSQLEQKINLISATEEELAVTIEFFQMALKNGDTDFLQEMMTVLQRLLVTAKEHEIMCLFSGEADRNGAFLEIQSGAGGTESDDWASMLLRMYLRFTENHAFKVRIMDNMDGEEAGIKSCTLKIEGLNAYGWLKTESGIHRLVRISPFNAAGKRHTSFASVWVSPIVDDSITVELEKNDLRIDTYRSSGAGGQHVNTTDSAVRITHIPSGIVVQSQNDRSQHKNKDECLKILRSKLYELELQKKREQLKEANANKTDIGWGHQIRSYVLHPYQMVKDLRTQQESYDTGAVLDGRLEEFILSNLKLNAIKSAGYKG